MSSDALTPTGVVPRAHVTLEWFPGLATANVGDAITPVVVSSATADLDGNFALNATPSSQMLKEAASNDGWINLDVVVKDGAGATTSRSISRAWAGGRWTSKGRAEFDPASPVSIPYLYDASGDLVNGTKGTTVGTSGLRGKAAGGTITPAVAYGCQFVLDSSTRNSIRVLNFHNSSNADSSWGYGSTADSDVDAGSKPYGAASWRVSGSVHVGNSSSASIGGSTPNGYDRWTRTDFRFQKGHIRDYYGSPNGTACSGSSLTVGDEKVSAGTWAGGIADDSGAGSEHRTCDTYPRYLHRGEYRPGGHLYVSASRATRIGFVVALGYINLGGTSGYSTNVDMRWDVKRGNGVWLCGQTGDEVTNPGVIYNQNL